jgi:hypothetical protein
MKTKVMISLMLMSVVVLLLVVPSHGEERPTQKAFKGVELYSWMGSEGAWHFALVSGTNRLKTEAEIKKVENSILGVKELEKRFLRLAEGEQVFWYRDLRGFAYPDEKTMADIESSAKKAKVELHTSPKREKD